MKKYGFAAGMACFSTFLVLADAPGAAAQGKASAAGSGRPMILMSLADPGPIGLAETPAVFAQFAVGGGYSTVFTILNTGSTPATGSLILTDSNGAPLSVTIQSASSSAETPDRVLATTAPISIPPGGTQFITASALIPSETNILSGWARVESNGGTLNGVATFQLTKGTTLSTIAGVLGGTPVSVATIPVDDDASRNRFTGYAIANTGTGNVNVRMILVNSNGTVSQTPNIPALNPLGPGKQVARFLFQDLSNPNLNFKGSMVFIAQPGQTFAVVALVLDRELLTAIPVIPSKAPGIN